MSKKKILIPVIAAIAVLAVIAFAIVFSKKKSSNNVSDSEELVLADEENDSFEEMDKPESEGTGPESEEEESSPDEETNDSEDPGVSSEKTSSDSQDGPSSPGDESDRSKKPVMYDINTLPVVKKDDNYRTCYEVFVRSFYDSDGDGIGDLKGLTEKLDYINDGNDNTDNDLGFDALWLMPVMPSPTYHKYDVTDYENIDPEYGTMEDFEKLVEECHSRGIKIYIDFVMNHTSSQHEWFKQATDYLKEKSAEEIAGLAGENGKIASSDCEYLDYYNFTTENKGSGYTKLEGTKDGVTIYYESQFWSEMPDLNLSSTAVRGEMEAAASFWLDKGVDGFRLDATTYYSEAGNDANIEILKWFNSYVKSKKEDAYIVGEAWTDEKTYSKMYESGVDSFFSFDFANKDGIIAKTVSGNSKSGASSYGKALETNDSDIKQYAEKYIDAPFLSNHDTGRAAGYFAGDDSESQLKMAWALSLFQGGSAYVYYGEELGMKGSGKDENKRVGMYWSKDSDAEGMCKAPDDAEEVEMKYDSYEEQKDDYYSIYNFMKQLIKLRNMHPEIARGENEFLSDISNDKICAIKKSYEGKEAIIIYNLSNESADVDVSGLSTNGFTGASMSLGGLLQTQPGDIGFSGEATYTLPPYSAIILN